jgi:hypothetical protein
MAKGKKLIRRDFRSLKDFGSLSSAVFNWDAYQFDMESLNGINSELDVARLIPVPVAPGFSAAGPSCEPGSASVRDVSVQNVKMEDNSINPFHQIQYNVSDIREHGLPPVRKTQDQCQPRLPLVRKTQD